MLWLSHLDLIELFILLSIEIVFALIEPFGLVLVLVLDWSTFKYFIVFALIEPFGSWITKRKREMANRDTHRMQPPLISIRSAMSLNTIHDVFYSSSDVKFVIVSWIGLMCRNKLTGKLHIAHFLICIYICSEVLLQNFTLL